MVRNPSAVIALNLPSLDKYEGLVKPGGVLIYNSSLVERAVYRTDLRVIPTPANAISMEETAAVMEGGLGDARLANVVMLGALLYATGILPLEAIETALADHLPQRHRRWLEPNGRALRRGAAVSETALAK
jgi:2-oxoglutarate ferredoxin oxidoreductase subunit gamma